MSNASETSLLPAGLPFERPQPSSPRPKRPLLKRWSTWFLLGLTLLLVGLAFLPTFLGSKWLYQRLVDQLAVEGFRLKVDSAEFAWLRPVALHGIELEQVDAPENRRNLLAVESIASNRSLMGYLLHGRDLGTVTIRKPKLDVELLENSSNVEKLVRSIEQSSLAAGNKTKSRPKLDIQILIEDLSVGVRRQDTNQELLVIPPVDLDLRYRSRDQDARIEIAPALLLDRVAITPELVRLGLGRAIPLLANSAWFDGQISAHIDAMQIPLDQPALAKGRAEVTLHQVRSGPSDPIIISVIDMIGRFRKSEIPQELVFIDGSIVQIQVGEGKVEHRGVQVGFPRVDQRLQLASSGTVGLIDRELQVGLGIPVPIEMLARRESVQQLGIPQITLPIRGTIDSPVVDWGGLRGDSADLLSLISAALGDDAPGTAAIMEAASGLAGGNADEAIGAAIDVIKELRQRRLERKARTNTESEQLQKIDQESQNPPPRRPIRDALKNILGGGNSGN